MLTEPIVLEQRIQELEKANRILQKKLERSEANRSQLEESHFIQEKFINQVIAGLERSQTELKIRNQELESTLSHLRAMQTKLVESEKMSALGVLVAGVAHEINNPINFIHGNITHASQYVRDLVELLAVYQHTYPQPEQQIVEKMQAIDLEFLVTDLLKLLDSMKLGSDRIRNIVLGLRTFSRHDEADFKATDIHEGIDSSLMILQHRLKVSSSSKAIQVVKNYGKLPKVPCFAGQLNQVFMNLLCNAIDALEDTRGSELQALGGEQNEDCIYSSGSNASSGSAIQTLQSTCLTPTIWIHTEVTSDQHILIRIANNGSAIPDGHRSKLFEPFFTTKPVGRGTGLGLSISYQIVVDKHNGSLYCRSLPDRTEFVIEIPLDRSVTSLSY